MPEEKKSTAIGCVVRALASGARDLGSNPALPKCSCSGTRHDNLYGLAILTEEKETAMSLI